MEDGTFLALTFVQVVDAAQSSSSQGILMKIPLPSRGDARRAFLWTNKQFIVCTFIYGVKYDTERFDTDRNTVWQMLQLCDFAMMDSLSLPNSQLHLPSFIKLVLLHQSLLKL